MEKKDLNDPNGDGFSGFVHQVVIDKFLNNHEAPEDLELYFLWSTTNESSSY